MIDDDDDDTGETQAYFVETSNEPCTYQEAISSPEAPHWREAIKKELDSIDRNGTWEIIPRNELPKGRQPIDSKWVFKRKLNPDGTIEKYKARLVAKGYAQVRGVDYDETYAPVAKFTSIRALLSIAAALGLEVHQMDVKCAFLNGDLKEDIFMNIPEGIDGIDGNFILKLKKSLYGLKQGSHCWNQKLHAYFISQGFTRLSSDYAIYVRRVNDSLIIVAVYVDDSILMTDSKKTMTEIKEILKSKFEMTDCGELKFFLGIQVHRNLKDRTITLGQEHFVEQILRRFGMSECKPVGTPIETSAKFAIAKGTDQNVDPTIFRQIVGSLMYLMVATRPDIAAAVSIISQFSANPSDQHLQGAKRILRYLRGTAKLRLSLGPNVDDQKPLQLVGYSDASWGDDINTRKSTSGYVFYLGKGPISWISKKQSAVALSSTEAEYMAVTQATKEAIWLRRLLAEIDVAVTQEGATLIYQDNQSTIALAKNPVHHARSKHIDIQYHFVREKVEHKEVDLQYIPTEKMIADIFTKPLAKARYEDLIGQLALSQSEVPNCVKD